LRLTRDERPREVAVPEDLAAALSGDAAAGAMFDRLAFTHRKEYVEWITGAKREETRRQRIEKMATMLREGVRTPKG
jgi:uncharacterized protein YdeI (YjbR/CyaY-like superfamily)